uniref:BTB domain-containing protein n=1 Tax=Cuerna arida TaxID=1464854 RepID=A0A1B6GQ17_9HEMI
MAKPQIYNMKWDNYQKHIGGIFVQLLESETMVDVTLCAEGEKISCHRIILSACSPYFQDILKGIPSSHAIVILCGISAEDARSIVEFVYKGELSVSSERFTSILRAAEALKISGLMEVTNHLPVLHVVSDENTAKLNENLIPVQVKEEILGSEDGSISLGNNLGIVSTNLGQNDGSTSFTIIADENEDQSDFSLHIATQAPENKRRRKREFSKKDYSEDALSAALDDLAQGRSLLETANTHHIPRSTLYARARSYGITPTITRQEHSEEKITAAVETVKAGASLQTASAMYSIPKTVLWRRVQKDIGCYALSRRAKLRQRYLPHAKEAAVRALENGEKINKVASQYKIPKTTLFREKSRLVEAGKLPLSCLNRRVPNNDSHKQVRLTQAVAACKEGRMSQAAASSTFKVSKTTIWRRLHQSGGTKQMKYLEPKTEPVENELDFQEVVTEIPMTYHDEREYPEASLIILNNCGGELAYQEGDQIVVDGVLVPESIEDVGEVIEIQETPSYSEEVPESQVEEIS